MKGTWILVLAACCGGVPREAVTNGAISIRGQAEVAGALHAVCVAGGDASAQACDKEQRALTDIESTANALLVAAGATDAGADR